MLFRSVSQSRYRYTIGQSGVFSLGGWSKAGDLILKPTRESMEANLIQIFQNKVKILVSHLKESDAAILGASALAWDLK